MVAFDLEAGEVVQRLELPIDEGVTEGDYSFEAPHHGLAISPDESTLCAAGRASDYAALIDTKTFEPTAIIDVGDGPKHLEGTTVPEDTVCGRTGPPNEWAC